MKNQVIISIDIQTNTQTHSTKPKIQKDTQKIVYRKNENPKKPNIFFSLIEGVGRNTLKQNKPIAI